MNVNILLYLVFLLFYNQALSWFIRYIFKMCPYIIYLVPTWKIKTSAQLPVLEYEE